MNRLRFFLAGFAGLVSLVDVLNPGACLAAAPAQSDAEWPELVSKARPWAYWWWMGSAVDEGNLSRELARYAAAGMGGVHIIPIYGAKGFEERYLEYMSPNWLARLDFTVREAEKLGLGVDMTTGSGWCFGGVSVKELEANALVQVSTRQMTPNAAATIEMSGAQAIMAFGPNGRVLDLKTQGENNSAQLTWAPQDGDWRLFVVRQKPSGQMVKRAAPGGQGHMLNLFNPEAMKNYLGWFDARFAEYQGAYPRAMYHDSYEYRCDWAPNLFDAFARRRGYKLQTELPALFASGTNLPVGMDADHVARVKCDYRETISDLMVEETLPLWTAWAHKKGSLTRNQAHGSPGNWLDLYGVADIPETEMFHTDRDRLISKFASSAAHTLGKPWVASETGTWLKEHFTETLADMKYLLDDLFLSGVNHVVYHGTCYSPDDAPWPGWLFYASYEMNPRNSIWRDVGTLNNYAARCQSILRSGQPDNDILVYWPIYDLWHDREGMARNLSVHNRGWFEPHPIGRTADYLWKHGYAFDYVSDRQLGAAAASGGVLNLNRSRYQVVVVPETRLIPVATLSKLVALAEDGGTVIFAGRIPQDVPGWANLSERRLKLKGLIERIEALRTNKSRGKGRVLIGDLPKQLETARVSRERMFEPDVAEQGKAGPQDEGLMCIRRRTAEGWFYFIANRSEKAPLRGWVPLARPVSGVKILDPMTGRSGVAEVRRREGTREVFLALEPGESIILSCLEKGKPEGERWKFDRPGGRSLELSGNWSLHFVQGGPVLPAATSLPGSGSWTDLTDTNCQAFAGTGLYTLEFEVPKEFGGSDCVLDLGQVCQSANVAVNGDPLGALITPPFRVVVPKGKLKAGKNVLKVEVTNVSANRIRDLDKRGVKWRNFHDINFVNLNYKPFDASAWPLTPSGLLGPVKLHLAGDATKQ